MTLGWTWNLAETASVWLLNRVEIHFKVLNPFKLSSKNWHINLRWKLKSTKRWKKDSSNFHVVNRNCKKLETCMPFSILDDASTRYNSFAFEEHHSLLFIYIGDFPSFKKPIHRTMQKWTHVAEFSHVGTKKRRKTEKKIQKRVYHL